MQHVNKEVRGAEVQGVEESDEFQFIVVAEENLQCGSSEENDRLLQKGRWEGRESRL